MAAKTIFFCSSSSQDATALLQPPPRHHPAVAPHQDLKLVGSFALPTVC